MRAKRDNDLCNDLCEEIEAQLRSVLIEAVERIKARESAEDLPPDLYLMLFVAPLCALYLRNVALARREDMGVRQAAHAILDSFIDFNGELLGEIEAERQGCAGRG